MPLEHWIYSLPLRLRSLFRRGRVENDLDDELRFHLDVRIAQEMAAGKSPAEARIVALREIGGLDLCKEECRDMRRTAPLENLVRDIRLGLRVLAKSPSFTAIACLTLMLGIGANTAIFSVVNAVLLRPLPYPESGQLVRIYETNISIQNSHDSASAPNFTDWRRLARSFAGIVAMRREPFTISGSGNPEFYYGQRVTPGMLAMLGVRPAIGRDFAPEDAVPGHDRTVLVSHELWMRRFAGDRSIVGRDIRLNFESYTVAGVLPPGFRTPSQFGPSEPVEMLLPLAFTPAEMQKRGSHNLQVFARLRPHVSAGQAQADMDGVAATLARTYSDNAGRGIRVVPLLEEVVGNSRASLRIIFAAALLILLISCANIANAILARGIGQQREIALRLALGAGRYSILRQLLVQNLLLTALGCAGGIAAAFWILRSLRVLAAGNLPRIGEIGLDGVAVVYAAAVSLLTGLAFGLLPAIHLSRPMPADALKSRGGASAAPSLLRWRSVLVVAQVTLSIVLVAGAGLLLKSFATLRGIDMGFQPSRTLALKILLPRSRYPEQAKRLEFFDRLTERVQRLPGVKAAGYSNQLPLRGGWGGSFQVENPEVPMGPNDDADFQIASPGYFDALRVRLLRGRLFNASDNLHAAPAVMVNGAFVRRYWPNTDPVGQHLMKNGEVRYTIVGVVEDVHLDGPARAANIEIYFASGQAQPLPVSPGDFVVRTAADPRQFINAIRREVWSIDREQPVTGIQTMDEALSQSTAESRFNMLLLVFFAGVGLLLAAVGIYGVLSYSVAQRAPEIGLRMAVGARPADILRLVLGRAAGLIAAGAALGLAASMALGRYAESMLFGVTPRDPAALSIAVGVLAIAGLAAAWIPARRAVRIDPITVMRVE